MRTTGRARRGTRTTTACRWPRRVVPRDAGHRGQRVLSRLSGREREHAVGRGGVLDLAAHWAGPDARLTLDRVHRFADYAQLNLAMRSPSPTSNSPTPRPV